MKRLHMGDKIYGWIWWPLIMFLWIILLSHDRIQESKIYRTVFNLNPFSDVVITQKQVNGNSMTISGYFIKHRCKKIANTAYTRALNEPNVLAKFSADLENPDTPQDRPAFKGTQNFGPWKVTSMIPDPYRALLVVVHQCKEGTVANVFFNEVWENLK